MLCNPFGYEAICAHRSLRHFAENIAASGAFALRFDYDGTGDSAGDDRDPDRLGGWIRSTQEAVRTLREQCGVERVWLLGVRLGALVAVLASNDVDVAGVIAIAPVVSGKAYLRELKLLQVALGLRERPADAPVVTEIGEGGQEALGFAIEAETRAALMKIDLTKIATPPCKEVLVLDRADLPSAAGWVAHLERLGVAVTAAQPAGYVEMMLDPHRALVPAHLIDATTSWLRARQPLPAAIETPRTRPKSSAGADMGEVHERHVFVDDARRIYAVLSTPTSVRPSGRAVLLLNAGAIHHIGPNRLYVMLARQWAAAGDSVLRLDITGLGDSPARAGETENTVYSPRAVEDVGVAVAWLREQPHVRSVWSVGLCSGAYHAFKGAAAGQDVSGIVAINPLTFFWSPATPLDFPAFPAFKVTEEAERYKRAAFDPSKWKKLLRGQVNVRYALDTLGRRALGRALDQLRDVSRRLHMPWKDDVGAELDSVARRSVVQRFVFVAGDPGRQLLRDQGGSTVVRLRKQGSLFIDVIEGPDHTFTPLWSHGPLAKALTAALETRPKR